MPGPKRRPTALNEALGNPGHRKKAKTEPKPEPLTDVTPPDWLDENGKKEWLRVSPELLKLGVLTKVDTMALALYCQAVSDLIRHTETCRVYEVYDTPSGQLKPRPEIALRKAAVEQIIKLCAEFGFTPSARARMNVTTEQKKAPTLMELLNGNFSEDERTIN